MRQLTELIGFLEGKMSMTDIYQPAIILHLLERDGSASKTELARTLSGYDGAIQAYYEKIVMRWPKITLTKHHIVTYEAKVFNLNFALDDSDLILRAKSICEEKIREWIEKHPFQVASSTQNPSRRFRVLKAARGKCELCGISAKISPIDIDHIIPRSQADKHGYVLKDNVLIHVDDERNLQALCYRCNRAKRDLDTTDFRLPRSRIIRERSVEYVVNEAQRASARRLTGKELEERLYERLVDEHARLLDARSAERLEEKIAEMIDVLLAIAKASQLTEQQVIELIRAKRASEGGFDAGLFLADGAA
jgi:5-methylcytosine-specific restriction endonuclease McrA